MSWLDDRLSEQEAFRARHDAIVESASKIYDALWEQISAFVQEAKGKGVKVATNGAAYDRVIQTFQRSDIHVRLAEDKLHIAVLGMEPKLRFDLDVRPDGVVCLVFEDNQLSITEAAIKILDAFLFPNLQRRY